MREILFRGKRTDNGEWVYGQLARVARETSNIVDEHELLRPVANDTVGQYTGLTDKNGAKIFEGDVILIKTNYGAAYDTEFLSLDFGVVKMCGYCYGVEELSGEKEFVSFDKIPCGAEIDVIGNIHDNPELLKEELE